jgi:hypothetical protein
MRRFVFPIIVATGLVVIGAGGASAAPGPTASAANATPGKKVCKVTDPKLDELSGIVATKSGFIVINDSSSLGDRKRVFYLDAKCKITKSVSYSGNGPRDTEDLILSADGKTLWIADTGDNTKVRDTISLWTMPVDGSTQPKIHRLAYPNGDKHDSEALLLNGDGTPIIVTKEIGKPAGIYTPTAPLQTNNVQGVRLKKVGELTPPPSSTPANELSRLGRGSIDGAAMALGGDKVVLRTYTDALEWTVSGGDVLAAIKGKPRITPLPNEPFGEAIAYTADGKNYVTVSDMQGETQSAANYILSYAPAANVAATTKSAATAADAKKGPGFFSSLTLNDITYLVAGVGVIGAILVAFGIFGIVRARKRPPSDPLGTGSPDGPTPLEAQTEFVGVGGAQQPGMYGRGGGAPPPGVYGGRPAAGAPQRGAGVYGADPRGGRPGQPGRPPQGQPARAPQGQPARPAQGQPGRPGQGGGRPGQPARPPQGQPARPAQGQPGRPGGGGGPQQPPARPGRGGGGGGVYGAPPPPQPPQGPARGGPRPSAYNDRDSGPYADVNGYSRGRDRDNPDYGRTPYSR